VDYSKLLLSTGSSPRRLSVPGADLDGVLYLRSVADSDRIKTAFRSASRVALIGGGWIGLETAAAARAADVEVTVLETAELPLLRVLGRQVARIFADLHREHEVDLRCGVQITEITGTDGKATGVRLADGSHIPADAVIAGIGITPNSQLASAAGLQSGNGIWVDAQLRSSHPDIYAAGDVANARHPGRASTSGSSTGPTRCTSHRQRLRRCSASTSPTDRVPYFFTDQYDLGMEYSGYVEPGGHHEVIFRGNIDRREFIAFWLGAGGQVLAGMNVNTWDASDAIRALVRAGQPVDKTALRNPARHWNRSPEADPGRPHSGEPRHARRRD
jgi:3-phenylpropionate/trans-cinnamate dioxygenase ferredoxin reductase component